MNPRDEAPGPLSALMIAFCLGVIAAVLVASFYGMTQGVARATVAAATDCESLADLCERAR